MFVVISVLPCLLFGSPHKIACDPASVVCVLTLVSISYYLQKQDQDEEDEDEHDDDDDEGKLSYIFLMFAYFICVDCR